MQHLTVFLCHSSHDKTVVRTLAGYLRARGIDPWLDEEKLLAGQDWNLEIPKAVRDSNVVIVCLSRGSVTKAGYVQKEIKYALDVADEQPEGRIFLIPLKLEECDVPEQLRRWQWLNYFEDDANERLMRALVKRADELGIIFPPILSAQRTAPKNLSPAPSQSNNEPNISRPGKPFGKVVKTAISPQKPAATLAPKSEATNCGICGWPFEPGEEITYTERDGWIHAAYNCGDDG